MQTKQAFNREFPELTKAQALISYHYLEIIHPKGADDPEFRRMVVDSVDSSNNLMSLCTVVQRPLVL